MVDVVRVVEVGDDLRVRVPRLHEQQSLMVPHNKQERPQAVTLRDPGRGLDRHVARGAQLNPPIPLPEDEQAARRRIQTCRRDQLRLVLPVLR